MRRLLALVSAGLWSTAIGAQASIVTDAEVERCLADGEIVKKVEVLIGVTSPLRYLIECQGEQRSAAFKRVDESRKGVTRLSKGERESNFTDSYRYERAAYLLDRELGIGRVPVAVLRRVKGDDGALVQWIDNASPESQLGRQLTAQEIAALARQKRVMHLFDALIYNTDRRPENWLVGTTDLQLHLIDHSRAFRWQHELPEECLQRPARLSRELHQALQGLSEPHLFELLDGLLDGPQIRALVARRDLLLEKIANDVAQHGEEAVFSD